MTIQLNTIEQYFHVVLFIMLYKVVIISKSVDETLVCGTAIEQYFHVVLFRWFVFLSVDETLLCDYSKERYRLILSYCKVLNLKPVDEARVCFHQNGSY